MKKYFDVELLTYNNTFHCEEKSIYKDMPEDYLNLLKKSCTCDDFISMYIQFSYGVTENDSNKEV